MKLTAETLFTSLLHSLQNISPSEREKFFSLFAKNAFSNGDNLSHVQLFGDLEGSEFTANEAAEYLDISIATFRRYCKQRKIANSTTIGTSHLYSLTSLRELKKALKLVR